MRKELQGMIFGKLTVLRPAKYLGRSGRFRWLCKCKCGNFCYAYSNNLTSGGKKSCGCGSKRNSLKGHGSSPTYSSWTSMHRRCYDKQHPHYSNYGGRGILVCDQWHDFPSFLSDMGHRPNGFTLERIDNNVNYCPENCTWASKTQQSRNRTKFTNNSSGRTGVYELPSGKFRATITVDKVTRHLGVFETYEEACQARAAAEEANFGFTKE